MDTYLQPEFKSNDVVAVDFMREFWRGNGNGNGNGNGKGKRVSKGVVAPFSRDWDEVRKDEESGKESTRSATPDEQAGLAFVITDKLCVDKPSEKIFFADDSYRANKLHFGQNFASDLLITPAEQLPKWLPQFLSRIERGAESNEVNAKFLAANSVNIVNVSAINDPCGNCAE